jgi:carbonic anhydrase
MEARFSVVDDLSRAALERLKKGNLRFLEAIGRSPDPAAATASLAVANPFAVVLACADSRAAPEIVLDETLGNLFVVRVAGNVAGQAELGSIEIAVDRWNCALVLVLGHTRCAAVAAALGIEDQPESGAGRSTAIASPNVTALLSLVRSNVGLPSGRSSAAAWEEAAKTNVGRTRDALVKLSPLLRRRAGEGRLSVAGALYHVETGEVEFLPD